MLIAKDDETLPFGVAGQKCIRYRNITELRNKQKTELKQLMDSGELSSGR